MQIIKRWPERRVPQDKVGGPQANHIPWTFSFHFITQCDAALQAELERCMPGLWVVRSGGHFLRPISAASLEATEAPRGAEHLP